MAQNWSKTLPRVPSSFVVTLCAIALSAPFTNQAADYFVAPHGNPQGNGSRQRPWDLPTALTHPPAVQPGDTIWLDQGTYPAALVSDLHGIAERPITLRQLPGRRATLDFALGGNQDKVLLIRGDHVTFWGFEVTCSDSKRVSAFAGSWPEDIRRGSIHCRASHVKLINLAIHDTANGVGLWAEGEAGEVYGSLIYHNGWRGPDRGHGHAIYAQNSRGMKQLVDNVLFRQFDCGIHVYGSQNSSIEGFNVEGNAAFDNGSLHVAGSRAWNILVGGGSPARRIAVISNFLYHSTAGTTAQLGYSAANGDLVCRANYLVGASAFHLWSELAVTQNTFVGPNTLVRLVVADEAALGNYDWHGNSYRSTEQTYVRLGVYTPKGDLLHGWGAWRDRGRLDQDGTYVEGPMDGVEVFIRPNRYEPGRAHVVVFNWDELDTVTVDLRDVLKIGQEYKIVSAQNFFGAPVAKRVYDGSAVQVPMQPIATELPVGLEEEPPVGTRPRFDVLVVLPVTNDASNDELNRDP
jgi:hypothetical protein